MEETMGYIATMRDIILRKKASGKAQAYSAVIACILLLIGNYSAFQAGSMFGFFGTMAILFVCVLLFIFGILECTATEIEHMASYANDYCHKRGFLFEDVRFEVKLKKDFSLQKQLYAMTTLDFQSYVEKNFSLPIN